ncbi:MAG: hypothetical protein U1F61_17875 [Opitutaceae bacterium]
MRPTRTSRAENRSYPSDLTRYSFHDLRPYLRAYRLRPKEGDFMVTLARLLQHVALVFSVGGWGYYPD